MSFSLFKKEEKKSSALKTVLIIVGAVVTLAAAAAVVYRIFKKYFTITFECGDCDSCEDSCFDEDALECDPICYCDDEETPAEEI